VAGIPLEPGRACRPGRSALTFGTTLQPHVGGWGEFPSRRTEGAVALGFIPTSRFKDRAKGFKDRAKVPEKEGGLGIEVDL